MNNRIINLFILIATIFISCESNDEKITDADGNVYNFVRIGNQEWLTENLRTTTFRGGNQISLVQDNLQWSKLTEPGYSYQNEASPSYGFLYNWYAVETDKLCPVGWHVPTRSEWDTLLKTLNSGKVPAVYKMKESGTKHWNAPNDYSTNESGFTALPAGTRYYDGTFGGLGNFAGWWSSTKLIENYVFCINIRNGMDYVIEGNATIQNGISVRCIRDN